MNKVRIMLIPILLSGFSLLGCEPNKGEYSLTISGHKEMIIVEPHHASSKKQTPCYSYDEGDLVVFKTDYVYDADLVPYLNGEKLTYFDYEDGLSFQFYMPNQDSELYLAIEGGFYLI